MRVRRIKLESRREANAPPCISSSARYSYIAITLSRYIDLISVKIRMTRL